MTKELLVALAEIPTRLLKANDTSCVNTTSPVRVATSLRIFNLIAQCEVAVG